MTKDTVDGQNMGRPAKRYSAVASRYAAPTAPKKPISPIVEAPSGGHTSITKLPFITGTCASFGSLNLPFLCPLEEYVHIDVMIPIMPNFMHQ